MIMRVLQRWRWLNCGGGILVLLLQRTPVLRSLVSAEVSVAAPAVSVLRSLLAPGVALGVVHSLAGATTQLVSNIALPAKATVGQPFSMSVVITGVGVSFAQSWDVTNTLPPGVTAQGASLAGSLLVANTSTGVLTISGTPTNAGTYTFTARGYQYTGRTGPVTTGSTSIVVAAAPNAAPAISRQPAAPSANVGDTITLSVGYSGNPVPTLQWYKNDVALSGATGPALVLSEITAADAGSYTVSLTNSMGSVRSTAAQLVVNAQPVAPTFVGAPQPQGVTAGGAAFFGVEVAGVPAPTLQWLKDGVPVAGATGSTLILNDVKMAEAGLYAVTATNASGSVTSPAARLTVSAAASAPAFAAEPESLTVANGSLVVLTAAAIGTPSPTYQWQRNGANLPGATSAQLILPAAVAADAGAYTVVSTNSLGAVTSRAAAVTVTPSTNPGRLINLSILTALGVNETMTLGTVLGGAGTAGTRPLLARAAGPSLATLGVTGVLPDPNLTLIGSSLKVVNDDWAGASTVRDSFNQVGAFAFMSSTSKDSAILQPGLTGGAYTAQVRDSGSGSGTVIAEIYDAAPASTDATPRLINVSVMKQLTAGGLMTAGFVIGGETARTVLIRAIGPGLAAFGVPGTMADPQLALYAGAAKIAENDNWGGDARVAAVAQAVGAFGYPSPDSRDATLLLTLAPGAYSAQVTGAGLGGMVLVEVYEVP